MFSRKMNMVISNGVHTPALINENLKVKLTTPKMGMALSSSMIGRIHNTPPGCGSCGK